MASPNKNDKTTPSTSTIATVEVATEAEVQTAAATTTTTTTSATGFTDTTIAPPRGTAESISVPLSELAKVVTETELNNKAANKGPTISVAKLELINWFELCSKEKTYLEISSFMKQWILPAFIKLAILNHRHNHVKFNQLPNKNRPRDNLLRSQSHMKAILESFKYRWPEIDSAFIEEIEDYTPTFHTMEYSSANWSHVYLRCELSSTELLSKLFEYLVNSRNYDPDIKISERQENIDKFLSSLKTILTNHYHETRRIFLFGNGRPGTLCPPPGLQRLFKLIKYFTKPPIIYLRSLTTATINVMEKVLSDEDDLLVHSVCLSRMSNEDRYHRAFERALECTSSLITKFMTAQTAVFLYFWTTWKFPGDPQVTNVDYTSSVFKNIRHDVVSAARRYFLLVNRSFRPYGFITESVLDDMLPRNTCKRILVKEIRKKLEYCIVIYMDTRFDFIARYPRTIQTQCTGISEVTNFYLSMIQSMEDFKIIYLVSHLMVKEIDKSINTKGITQASSPNRLINNLIKYFRVKE